MKYVIIKKLFFSNVSVIYVKCTLMVICPSMETEILFSKMYQLPVVLCQIGTLIGSKHYILNYDERFSQEN